MREFILLYDDDDYDNLWDEKEAKAGGEKFARGRKVKWKMVVVMSGKFRIKEICFNVECTVIRGLIRKWVSRGLEIGMVSAEQYVE